jgi:hypothetical protein
MILIHHIHIPPTMQHGRNIMMKKETLTTITQLQEKVHMTILQHHEMKGGIHNGIVVVIKKISNTVIIFIFTKLSIHQ